MRRRHPRFSELMLGVLGLIFSVAFYFGMALGRCEAPAAGRFDSWHWHPHGLSPFMRPVSPGGGSHRA